MLHTPNQGDQLLRKQLAHRTTLKRTKYRNFVSLISVTFMSQNPNRCTTKFDKTILYVLSALLCFALDNTECHEAISLRSFMKMMNTSNIIKNTDFNNLY